MPKPAELIVRQIRNLISSGVLKPGDRLPSERDLAERFGLGRGYVRQALRKLEFYGVLRTYPQRGTVVAEFGVAALERLIANLLDLERDDLKALMETRGILEMHAAQLAAERASEEAIAEIRRALEAFRAEVEAGRSGHQEDLQFHLAIAKAADNAVMLSLIGMITPDIIRLNKEYRTCDGGRTRATLREHEAVFAAIARHDPARVAAAMAAHLNMTKAQLVLKAAYAKPATPRQKARQSKTGT
jgi:GntR family transcriptional repressor for pyruvate dehydrogenase complex